MTPDGHTYYMNKATGESRWDRPVAPQKQGSGGSLGDNASPMIAVEVR